MSTALQKLHNRAARIIAYVLNEVDQQTVLNILRWEPLKEQRVKATVMLLFKTLNNTGPNCLKELFTFKKCPNITTIEHKHFFIMHLINDVRPKIFVILI